MTGHSGARGRQHKQRNEATAPTAQRVLKEQVPTRVSSTSAKNRLLKQQGVGRTSNHIKAEENQQLKEWENQHLNHLDIQIGQHTNQNDEDDIKDDMAFSRDLLTKLPELEANSSPQLVPKQEPSAENNPNHCHNNPRISGVSPSHFQSDQNQYQEPLIKTEAVGTPKRPLYTTAKPLKEGAATTSTPSDHSTAKVGRNTHLPQFGAHITNQPQMQSPMIRNHHHHQGHGIAPPAPLERPDTAHRSLQQQIRLDDQPGEMETDMKECHSTHSWTTIPRPNPHQTSIQACEQVSDLAQRSIDPSELTPRPNPGDTTAPPPPTGVVDIAPQPPPAGVVVPPINHGYPHQEQLQQQQTQNDYSGNLLPMDYTQPETDVGLQDVRAIGQVMVMQPISNQTTLEAKKEPEMANTKPPPMDHDFQLSVVIKKEQLLPEVQTPGPIIKNSFSQSQRTSAEEREEARNILITPGVEIKHENQWRLQIPTEGSSTDPDLDQLDSDQLDSDSQNSKDTEEWVVHESSERGQE